MPERSRGWRCLPAPRRRRLAVPEATPRTGRGKRLREGPARAAAGRERRAAEGGGAVSRSPQAGGEGPLRGWPEPLPLLDQQVAKPSPISDPPGTPHPSQKLWQKNDFAVSPLDSWSPSFFFFFNKSLCSFYIWDDQEYLLRLQSRTLVTSYKSYMALLRGRRHGMNAKIALEDFKGLLTPDSVSQKLADASWAASVNFDFNRTPTIRTSSNVQDLTTGF